MRETYDAIAGEPGSAPFLCGRELALEVGYASLSHFIQAFQETYGCPPGAYAQGADSK